ncbi:beta-N-acetylhexosaminidase [Microbacterium thalassium]|uniref:beta-N-acetylhexosaminidase n=1 Tax=Microbacterium thalassium TaxID=362649 RepID=A0A7X0KUJ0_9MICO|nr:beta-N-acetylhexosaminidase [Microbacterium thalassium]MBB6391217.1 hexosaminidase [Microbacterium thalassium]GLK23672.1 beta-N-acetylhexosaminidase [Microbacterium thalassium]
MSPLSLVPIPSSVHETGGAPLVLDERTRPTGDADAARELTRLIEARTGLRTRELGGDGGAPATAASAIDLRVEPGGAAESYRLRVAEDGATVVGADAAGLFYGVQTLAQLIEPDTEGWVIPAVEIEDAPRFAYRGVMLDVARHFFDVPAVRGYIDRAAGLKFNALHLHLTDDQGWRLHLDSRPALTERASGSSVGGDPGGFYTKDEYRDLVAYAAARHMIVVPEIDMPGHTHAVGLAYPELAEDPVVTEHMLEIVSDYGGEPPAAGEAYDGLAVGFSSLRINDEATYDFVADVFGELASLTPGPYLHLGGDECLGTDPADFAAFVARASAIVADLGKTPVTWHEAGAAGGLHPDTVGQYWGGVTPTDGMDDTARAFVSRGAQVILSPADAVYLDMKPRADSDLGLTWANGPTSVRRAYEWEPADVIDGIGEADILGVEAPLWTETVRTPADIDALAFPRIAAAAEAAWSPATGASDQRTWESFRGRVAGLAGLWDGLGIRFDAADEIDWVR